MSLIYVHSSGGKIFQAGAMEIPAYISSGKINAIVFSAEEYQPKDHKSNTLGYYYPSHIERYYVPLDDSTTLNKLEIVDTIFEAERAADFVKSRVQAGRSVLVTCWQGRNRSGLITGLALKKLTDFAPGQIVFLIQANRQNALTNSLFERIIQTV